MKEVGDWVRWQGVPVVIVRVDLKDPLRSYLILFSGMWTRGWWAHNTEITEMS